MSVTSDGSTIIPQTLSREECEASGVAHRSSWRSEHRSIPVATPTSPEFADFLAPHWSSPLDVEVDAYGDPDEVFGPTEFIAEDDDL
jgi:hypothetical protein